jgi:diguanylate cyclase (GGDEF)-like protein
LDHFKNINDTYGHLSGDKVIIAAVTETQKILRESDIIIRFGGEEFLVVLPNVSPKSATVKGNQLCQTIEYAEITDGLDIIKLTVSIGICCYPNKLIDSSDELIKYADKALYYSKENGRNQSTLFSEQLNLE